MAVSSAARHNKSCKIGIKERNLSWTSEFTSTRRIMVPGRSAATSSREESEERLLVEAAQRDPGRFIELYERNFERVYGFAVRRVRDRDAAEDLTSEVFLKALAHLPGFDWRGVPFSAWLIRIAINLVKDHWKRAAREVVEQPQERDSGTDPEQIENTARLFGMVRNLPPDQRRVVEMRFAEGKSIREIAQDMSRSEGAIKQLQFRALENLRVQLSEKHGTA
jgi:RNA polymerase sigma-70 factor (ECF subfamily)